MAKRSTKQQLMLSAIALLLCVSMLVGSTFAWFTDSVTSTNNIIKSGTLDVDLKYSTDMTTWNDVTDTTDLFSDCLWEPGFTKVVYLRVANIGTLALKYNLGINVVSEIPGKNVAGETFNLSDYIYFDVIEGVTDEFADRDAARAAATEGVAIKAGIANGGSLLAKTASDTDFPADTVALVVYMPETVGNEANYRIFDPATDKQPVVNLGINLFATQVESEVDSFDKFYDKDADIIGTDTEIVESNVSAYDFEIYEEVSATEIAKVGAATVPGTAVAADAEEVSVSIKKTVYDGNFTVAAGMESQAFDVVVTGLKDNNDVAVKIMLRIPANLDDTNMKLYHYDTEITNFSYDPSTGYVTFESTTFSPFTVVYDAEAVNEPEETPTPGVDGLPAGIPKATVTKAPEYVGTPLEWKSYNGIAPDTTVDPEPKLEAAYVFEAPAETEETAKFNDWQCDFYVKLDRDLGANQILLAGNYGDFGWVGFHNGTETVPANTEVPLLGSMGNPWTYEQIFDLVGKFTCGVGDVNDALDGATFTVMLRLTNPTNAEEYYNVNVVEYTFGDAFDDADHVSSWEELQDAINNGSGNIVLDQDIDANAPIVIPGN